MSIERQTSRQKPTIYHGVTFASRVEARWAWFWDQIGMDWEYEGYRYVVGYTKAKRPVMYKPDFWLPDGKLFIEVKGPEPTWFEQDKARRLAVVTDRPVTILHSGIMPEQLRTMTYASTWEGEEKVSQLLPHSVLPWPLGWPKEVIRQCLTEACYEREEFRDVPTDWGPNQPGPRSGDDGLCGLVGPTLESADGTDSVGYSVVVSEGLGPEGNDNEREVCGSSPEIAP